MWQLPCDSADRFLYRDADAHGPNDHGQCVRKLRQQLLPTAAVEPTKEEAAHGDAANWDHQDRCAAEHFGQQAVCDLAGAQGNADDDPPSHWVAIKIAWIEAEHPPCDTDQRLILQFRGAGESRDLQPLDPHMRRDRGIKSGVALLLLFVGIRGQKCAEAQPQQKQTTEQQQGEF